ncbi:MAG TPA: LamB/YcsF family protein, partial [Planococcus sp. (in: firmicutes)]|nr:LamB/YcsF family protein [Planococcus sp. (in: firmicutes)]
GTDAVLKAHTICIHGDGVNALAFAEKISKSLLESDIATVKVSEIV